MKDRILAPQHGGGVVTLSFRRNTRYTNMNANRRVAFGGWFLLVVFASLLLSSPLLAARSSTVRSVRVEGAQRIEVDTVRSYLTVDVGGAFSPDAIRQSMNALFATGYFKDVALEREGDTLVVRVVENPMVNEISFEGNDAFDEADLKKLIVLKSHDIYDQAKTERDLAALRQAYRAKGLFLAKIDVLTEALDNNRVNLVYQVEEGQKSKVQEVRILGNHGLSDKQLMKKLMIQPSDWLSWYTETDTYDREKLLFDQSQLRATYLNHGYVRAAVDSSVAELTPDRGAFLVTHTVREGARYRFGPIRVVGDFDELPTVDLYRALEVEEGAWYSQGKVGKSVEKLIDLIGDFGYAFLKINPERTVLDDTKTVEVTFHVTKGKRVYVNRIEVSGNTRTQDSVVRREVSMAEGDRFSASHLRKAKRRLAELNFFEDVEIQTPLAGDRELVDIKIKVTEKPTGTFTLGGGYSSQDAFIGTASVSQNNFLGKGQKLVVSYAYSGKRTDYNISFSEPYFLGRRLTAGFDLFNRDRDQTRQSSFKERTFGAAVHLGFPLSENLRNLVRYRFTDTEIDYTGAGVPSRMLRVQEELSPYLQSMISNTLTWDNLDDHILPTTGRIHRLTTDFSGPGGDVRFVRVLTDHHLYHPLSADGDLVAHVRGRFGFADGLGEDIPLFERFFLGGSNSLRGFMPAGIGPRAQDGDAYGGVHFEQINTELFFPVLGLTSKGVRGLVFLDAGFLGDEGLSDDEIYHSGSVRVATGVGIHWNSPFGPLRFTLSTPLMKEAYDETRLFDFSIGSAL